MKRLVLVLSVGLATVLPCLLSPGTASASAPYNYLSVQPSEMVFVQFTVAGTNVVGVMHDDVLNSSPGDSATFTPAFLSINSTAYNLSGTDTSGHLTLYISEYTVSVFGTMTAGHLSLQLPQSDGSVATLTLGGCSLNAYNNALARWQDQLDNENNAAANAEARAQQASENHQQLLNNLNAAITTVDNDLATMQSPGNLSGDLGQVDDDLGQVQDDLGQTKDDNAQLTDDGKTDSGHATLCGDVVTEYQDAGVVVSDTNVMVSDAKSDLDSDLGQDQQTMDNAPADWATYWAAQHALPTEVPITPIPPLKVGIAEGQATINQAVAHVNADIRQANSYIAQAYAMPNAAQKAMSCGATKKVPVIKMLRWT
jgi:hypothetical protein